MIDIEQELFRAVKAAVTTTYSGAFVTGEYVKAPKTFPCVTVIETGNVMNQRTIDSSGTEKFGNITYEVNCYSNKTTGKKTECKGLLSAVDTAMKSMGFIRIMSNVIPNLEDATIYRMVARYRATVSQNNEIYGG